MNVAAIKLACWLTTIGIAFALAAFVYDFHGRRPEFQKKLDDDYIIGVLTSTKPPETVRVDHLESADIQRAIQSLNWTGRVATVAAPVETQGPVVTPRVSIKDILTILLIQVDTDDAAASRIFIRLLKPPPPPKSPDSTLATGAALPAPYEYVSVGEIRVDGVEFVYDDGEVERLKPQGRRDAPLVVGIGDDGVRYPIERTIDIPVVDGGPFRPEQTTLFRQNYYIRGTEDADYLAENYPTVLTNDLRYKTYVDPKTGRRSGIEIQSVRGGSVAERHGAQQGDIVLSINGHPVSSDQEAMSFVRNNQDKYTTWDVEILRLGRMINPTFQNPK
jgi:hypothetical protein